MRSWFPSALVGSSGGARTFHTRSLEKTLSERFGPLSQLMTKFDRRGGKHKGQVTMRQCGFPVELAHFEGDSIESAAKGAAETALSLDVLFLDPRIRTATASNIIAHAKGVFDELKVLCTGAARMLKFSISQTETGEFACRSFVRDDWAATSHLVPLIETINDSANTALNDNAFQVLQSYRAEFSAPHVIKEDYLELASHLFAYEHKRVLEMCTEDHNTRTFTVTLQVSDDRENTYQVVSKGNRTVKHSYSNAAALVYKAEFEAQREKPLLTRLRWQSDVMCQHVFGAPAQYVETSTVGSISGQLVSGGSVLAQESSPGAYRTEVKCLSAAVKKLLQLHPATAAHHHLAFLRTQDLDEALALHDHFDILTAHRGKWNAASVLGTLTNALLGSNYQSEFEDVPDGAHVSTKTHLFINDGQQSKRPLIARLNKEKGESWRAACVDAIRENFPEQHAVLLKHDEYALSISRTEGQTVKMKGLPREKQVQHFSSLFGMLQSFTQEDFTWTQMQLLSAAAPKGNGWLGEVYVMEAGKRRCVYQSDVFQTAKIAKKVACYAVGMAHFPKETNLYIGLNRGDYYASDRTFLEQSLSRTYDSRVPVTTQLCKIIEKHNPALTPVTWKLAHLDEAGRYRATVLGRGAPIADVASASTETPITALLRALQAACKSVGADSRRLMAEFMQSMPVNVANERDLATHLFVTTVGVMPTVHSVLANQVWVQTLALELDGSRVLLHRSEAETKKEGIYKAYVLGAKHSFEDLLKEMANTPCDARELAKAILARGGHQIDAPNASETAPSRAITFLNECMTNNDKDHALECKLEVMANGLTRATYTRSLKKGGTSEVAGTGTSDKPPEAKHNAAIAVLENLFDVQLAERLEQDPDMCDWEVSAAEKS